jgi:nucleoside-diphosphate-sugar epimerase
MSPAPNLPTADLDSILEHTAPLWDEARGRRIFLTGGTGFFGCWLLESFCYANERLRLHAKICVLTRNPRAFAAKCPHLSSQPAVSLLEGDVRTFNFPEGEFHLLVHAATDSTTRGRPDRPLDTFSTIVAGTERVLQFASAHGTRKFLLTSSGAVYGRQPAEITHVPESWNGSPDPLDARNAYSEGKRTAELLCSLYQGSGQLECKIARCWAFCGPHLPLDQHFAIGNFIGDVLVGRPIQIQGDGTSRRSYLYAADLAIWLWTILFRGPALFPFNVGSARDVSIHELAHIVASTLNPKAEIRVARQPALGAEVQRYVPCVDRAWDVLRLCERVGLESGIRKTAEWHASWHLL